MSSEATAPPWIAQPLGRSVTLLPAAAAVIAWTAALRRIDLSEMTDVGLVSVLPPMFVGALVLLTLGFVLVLCRTPINDRVLLLYVLLLITILYGSLPALEPLAPTPTPWRHVGIMDYILRHHTVDRTIDAYFNWPGFFILGAFVAKVVGFDSPMALARWAPLAFNLLYLLPVWVLFRAVTRDRRIRWLAIWFFFTTNWVGQDYLAPQAFGYLLFLTILAVLLERFHPAGLTAALIESGPNSIVNHSRRGFFGRVVEFLMRQDAFPRRTAHIQAVGLAAALILLTASVVPSHQLTPYALLTTSAALAVPRLIRLRIFPALVAVMIFGWFTFAATPYLHQFLATQSSSVGSVSENVSVSFESRLQGTPGHLLVVHMRVLLTGILWLLALLGASVRFRRGHRDGAMVMVALAPLLLMGLNPYGGEILLRVYLFSLPAMAFFSAALFFNETNGRLNSWRRYLTRIGAAAASMALLISFLYARYGNAQMDRFTPDDVAAVKRLYEIAPRGSLLLAGTYNIPWRWQRYAAYEYIQLDDERTWKLLRGSRRDFDRFVEITTERLAAEPAGRAYLIFTPSMQPWINFTASAPSDTIRRLESAFARSNRVRTVFSRRGAKIFAPVKK
jgi:hypothetical protein